jgi:hypothetical protein
MSNTSENDNENDFVDVEFLTESEKEGIKRKLKTSNRLSWSEIHNGYNLLSQPNTPLTLTYSNVRQYNIDLDPVKMGVQSHNSNKMPSDDNRFKHIKYYFFNNNEMDELSSNHQQTLDSISPLTSPTNKKNIDPYTILFEPTIIDKKDDPTSPAPELHDVLNYFQVIQQHLFINSGKSHRIKIKRAIIPIGEVNPTGYIFPSSHHIILLVIDIYNDIRIIKLFDSKKNGWVVRLFGYDRTTDIENIVHKSFTNPDYFISTPPAKNLMPTPYFFMGRTWLNYQGLFDNESCGYYTLKLIKVLIENGRISLQTLLNPIHHNDAFYSESILLSKDDIKTICDELK